MAETWRVVDTGLNSAARNIALTRALLEARRADEIPSTLRFLRTTRCALLGYHQSPGQELDLAYCEAHRIAVQRRVTGGAAWYVDERQLGWELYLHRRDVGVDGMQAIAKRICHAAASALCALGFDARYRARDDIEVDGRKVCATGSAADGDGLLIQGTLFVEIDLEQMSNVLRMPAAPAHDEAIACARSRMAGLKELLGRQPDLQVIRRNLAEAFESEFDVELREADLSLSEHARFEAALREIDTADWIHLVARPASDTPMLYAVHACAGGLLRAAVRYEQSTQVIREVWFSGGITVNPRRTIADLEAALHDLPISRLPARIESFFASRAVDMAPLAPDDFVTIIRRAVRQPLLA